MTYAKRLTPVAEGLIGPIIPAILSLEPGDSKVFGSKSPEHLRRARTALYGWFDREGLKGRYKLVKIDQNQLMVVCIEATSLVEITVAGLGYTAVETFVQDHLFNAETEDEARDIVVAKANAGEIADEAVVPIMDEFRKGILGQKGHKEGADIPDFPMDFIDQLENPSDAGPDAHVPAKKSFDILDESIKRNDADTEGGS